jgi:hypothetical protein
MSDYGIIKILLRAGYQITCKDRKSKHLYMVIKDRTRLNGVSVINYTSSTAFKSVMELFVNCFIVSIDKDKEAVFNRLYETKKCKK